MKIACGNLQGDLPVKAMLATVKLRASGTRVESIINNMFDNLLLVDNGMSPSGKAPGSGPGIRGFESLHPSQK